MRTAEQQDQYCNLNTVTFKKKVNKKNPEFPYTVFIYNLTDFCTEPLTEDEVSRAQSLDFVSVACMDPDDGIQFLMTRVRVAVNEPQTLANYLFINQIALNLSYVLGAENYEN